MDSGGGLALTLAIVEGVELLKTLLAADPSRPRLTCYDETTGGRTDLSALTLDNWAAKIGNMLHDEFDVEPGGTVWIDLPVIWQAACIVLGCERAGVRIAADEPLVVFTTVGKLSTWEERFPDAYIAAVTDDVFGRGVIECGGTLPPGIVDFGPEVRLHPDAYLGGGPDPEQSALIGNQSAADLLATATEQADAAGIAPNARLVTRGWLDSPAPGSAEELNAAAWVHSVVVPWVRDGAAVVVRGGDADRLAAIAAAEKATVLPQR